MNWNEWTTLFCVLYLLHNGFEHALDLLQSRHLGKPRDKVPKHLEGKVDLETIRKAAEYNRAKLRLGMLSRVAGIIGLAVMIAFGFGWTESLIASLEMSPLITGLLFFAALGAVSFVFDLPLEVYAIFGIEERYGFNKQTPMGFIGDKVKQILIGAVLGAGLLSCVLLLMEHGGTYWWLYAFGVVVVIQLLLAWIYPVAIMPMFNKFTPVEGDLADDVEKMARGVKFKLSKVMSMDGSKRSKHSNAFFIGLFGARRVVLYDTLIEKVGRKELLAVLAHEFGHFKLKHLTKRLLIMLVGLFATFAGLAYLKGFEGVYTGLGFSGPSAYAALVVFGLLVSEVTPPASWLMNILSRADERAADRFAASTVGNGEDLQEALVGLSKQNLASPGSHKWYRAYHNSHPTLKSRLKALDEHCKNEGLAQTESQ